MTDSENKTQKIRWGALLASISDTCKFAVLPCLTIGSAFTIICLSGGTLFPLAVGLGLLAGGAVLLTAAVATGYMASGYKQAESKENTELQAKTTAHHLAQELETRGITRADGKNWTEASSSVEVESSSRTLN